MCVCVCVREGSIVYSHYCDWLKSCCLISTQWINAFLSLAEQKKNPIEISLSLSVSFGIAFHMVHLAMGSTILFIYILHLFAHCFCLFASLSGLCTGIVYGHLSCCTLRLQQHLLSSLLPLWTQLPFIILGPYGTHSGAGYQGEAIIYRTQPTIQIINGRQRALKLLQVLQAAAAIATRQLFEWEI